MPSGISVLCVDDNAEVAESLRLVCEWHGIRWAGWLSEAKDLPAEVVRSGATVVVLDLNMPGPDPFEALSSLARQPQPVPVIVFTAHVYQQLIDQAVAAGAWGYVGKDQGATALLRAISEVFAGQIALGPAPDQEAPG
jgi:DNA-binding NarL/FixJ family response regulator